MPNEYSEAFLSKLTLIFLSLDCVWFCFHNRIKKKTTRVSLTIGSLVNETSNIRSSYSTLVQPLCIDPQRVCSVLKAFLGVPAWRHRPREKRINATFLKVYMRRAYNCITSNRTRKEIHGSQK